MSLARTALRLAAIAAFEADPVLGTLCVGRIYDSRIGPVASSDPVPVLTVYTEDDAGEAYSANNGGPPFNEKCEMLVEIAMAVTVEGGDGSVALVESDREIEACIDMLEHRVVEAITTADTDARRVVTEHVTRRVTGFKSIRFVSDDTTLKLAVRMLHLTVQLKGDDRHDAREVPTGPFAVLPNPLRAVAESLPEDSSGRLTCLMLVQSLAPPTVPPTLMRASFRDAPPVDAPATADFSFPDPST